MIIITETLFALFYNSAICRFLRYSSVAVKCLSIEGLMHFPIFQITYNFPYQLVITHNTFDELLLDRVTMS